MSKATRHRRRRAKRGRGCNWHVSPRAYLYCPDCGNRAPSIMSLSPDEVCGEWRKEAEKYIIHNTPELQLRLRKALGEECPEPREFPFER